MWINADFANIQKKQNIAYIFFNKCTLKLENRRTPRNPTKIAQ